jgi:hypothetical protein
MLLKQYFSSIEGLKPLEEFVPSVTDVESPAQDRINRTGQSDDVVLASHGNPVSGNDFVLPRPVFDGRHDVLVRDGCRSEHRR